jgi:ADP-ribose pyrophosphatase
MRSQERPVSKQPRPSHAKKVFAGEIFDVYQWEQQMFDGSSAIFEQLTRPDSAIVFGVLDDGRILLTKQEQPGKEPFIGAAGGQIDEGETPENAARRELLEETGYEAKELTLWFSHQPYSKIDWAIYIYIAQGLTKKSDQSLDPGERISLHPVTFSEFLSMAGNNLFSEKEVIGRLYEAQLDGEKRKALEALFSPLPK